MKKADLVVGADYAVVPYATAEHASRVRLLRLGAGSQAEVKVLTAVPMFLDVEWKRGAVVTMSTRRITCTWAEWEEGANERVRHQDERDAREADRERLEVPDPDREVPVAYEEVRLYRDAYTDELSAALRGRRSWSEPTVVGALELLPLGVQRDLVSAAIIDDLGRESLIEGSTRVADVLAPAVFLATRPRIAVRPDLALAGHDGDFVEACVAAVTVSGGHLDTPLVPRLRVSPTFERRIAVQRPALGWARVAFGWTTGRKLHAPDCHVLRSNRDRPEDAETMAMWRLDACELCGVCGGPGVVPNSAWVAFRAASDVWHVRRPQTPEQWQVKALLHLLVDAARGRACVGEPDRTREALLLDALADGMPGEDGWPAYRLTARYMSTDERPAGADRDAAATLAYRRLRQLSNALGPTERPVVPFPLDNADTDGNIPGPTDTADAALRTWLADLDEAAGLSDLHLSLFGLPGAIRAW